MNFAHAPFRADAVCKEPRQVIGRVGRVGEQEVVGWGPALGDERVEVLGFVVDGGEADGAEEGAGDDECGE